MKLITYSIRFINLIYLLILFIVFFSKKRVNNKETKAFSYILVANVVGVLLEIFNYMLLLSYDESNILYVMETKIIIVYYLIWGSLFLAYEFILFKKNTKYLKIFTVIVSIILLFIKMDFKEVGEFIIPQGIVPNTVYLVSAVYVIICIYLTITNYDREKIRKYIPLIALIFLLGATIYVQYIWPELLLTTIAESVVVFIMYFTIENPDVKMVEEMTVLKDQADKANNAKSEFLSNMSHEIRTPLNAIVGFSESLKDDDLTKDQEEKVNDIIMASNNLLEIVNGILDISKIEANKLEIIDKEYDIKSVLDELVALTRARMGEDSPLDFQVSIDQTIPRVLYGDNVRLKQIVLNLLTNAVKYTKEGYVKFTVSQITKGDVCRLIFSVEDSGIGIKEEALPRLFSKFDRLNVEKSLTIEGTGLGLAITKKLIELMNGRIVVQSVYGKGSKFTVSIDQRVIAVTPPEVRETAASESKVIDVKGAKILIVDDNELNIKVASTLLRKYGLDIDSCTNGPDALRKLIEDKQQYDIVFLDDMMPRMSGREVLENLQRHPEYKIPTIALTANAIEGMKEEYLSAGFNDYLSKPIERGELERVLKKFISKQNMELSNATTTDQVKSAIKLEDSLVLPKLVESPAPVEEKTPKKILIVDDDDMNLKVISMMLKNYGYDLTLVSSGSEAIMKVMENTYDLILMDDMMPELDGSATLDNLKDIEGFNTPVVLLTANSEDDVRSKIEEHGFSGYLGKPINKEALNDITIKYLN